DSEQDRPVVWVNETFARVFLDHVPFGDRITRAVGERFDIGGRVLEIAGVVSDAREFGLREPSPPTAYLPLNIKGVDLDLMQIVARTDGPPTSIAAALRVVATRVDPSIPLTNVRTMQDVAESSVAGTSFITTLLTIAAIAALALGTIGVYGVMRYVVSQRAGEIAIRMTLGADSRSVRVMFLRQGLFAVLTGVVVGLLASYALAGTMAALLFEVSARDPAVLAIAAVALTA